MKDTDGNDDEQRSQEYHEQFKQNEGIGCYDTIVNEQPQVDAQPCNNADADDDEEIRLDYELQILRNMRSTFVSALHILESARDDLNHSIPHDIDELRRASEQVRAALAKLREQIQ